jgi:hypothetical protein
MVTRRITRSHDPIAQAKLIGDIATGQTVDSLETVDEAGRSAIKDAANKANARRGEARAPAHKPGKRGS